MNVQPAIPQLKVKLDWKAYYQRFSEAHGGYPIVYKGQQLFADGWGYSLRDYEGPEFPPPTEPEKLRTLQRVYWYTRWNRAKNEHLMLCQRFDALKGLQDNKNIPLQQVVISRNEETRKVDRTTIDWEPRLFEHIISQLQAEIDLADSKLKELADAQ